MSIYITKNNYKIKNWIETFPDKKIDINKTISYFTRLKWKDLFDNLFSDKRMNELIKTLEDNIDENIFPYPSLLFNAFFLTDIYSLKVVFIGQDPYYMCDTENDVTVPQAMGLAFSVPYNMKIPMSLKNIYSNMKKNNIKSKIYDNGNLEMWALQGCLMLNTSLTVIEGEKNKNCHKKIWNIIFYNI